VTILTRISTVREFGTRQYNSSHTLLFVRLSPIGDPSGDPNPKWVSNRIPLASKRVPIWKAHFLYQERYNPNLNILSLGDSFVEMILFGVLLLEKTKNGY